jgi:RHS repeat-associated protein
MTTFDRDSAADTTYLYFPATDATGGGLGDSNFRLQTIQHGAAGSGNKWPDFIYEYDRVGNITEMITTSTDGTDEQDFTYDHLNRLLTADATGGVADYGDDYSYNKLGNITAVDSATYTYGDGNHKQAVTAITGGHNFVYDANGNMTDRIDSTGVYSQTFNVENELATVTKQPPVKNDPASVTNFTYDAGGQRVKTVEPDGTIIDYPFPGYEVSDPGLSSQTVRLTLSLGGQAVAVRVITNSDNDLYYLFNDHLGSTGVIGNGNVVAGSRTYYMPFGDYRVGGAPTQTITDRGYTGHLHNNTGANGVGLIYMNARFYVPGIGRFASADTIVPNPFNAQAYNRYAYVYNNPLLYSDPSGHCAENVGDEACWGLAESLSYDYGIGLQYTSQLTYEQLSNTSLARVLAYTLYELDQVALGNTTDVEAMMAILTYAIEDVAGGNYLAGLNYAASIFYRDQMKLFGVIEGFDYKGVTTLRFGTSGFKSKYGTGNQVEHFINEAYAIAVAQRVISHGPIGDAAGLVAPVLYEIKGWYDNDFHNSAFVPDTLLGWVAAEYADALYTDVFAENRAEITAHILSQLMNPSIFTSDVTPYPQEDFMRPPTPPQN